MTGDAVKPPGPVEGCVAVSRLLNAPRPLLLGGVGVCVPGGVTPARAGPAPPPFS